MSTRSMSTGGASAPRAGAASWRERAFRLLALATIVASCSVGGGGGGAKSGEEEEDLQVVPATGFDSLAQAGGAPQPGSFDYALTNATPDDLAWTASADRTWILLSATSGTLASLAQDVVTVSLDDTQTASFATGTYTGTVTFDDQTNGTKVTRQVTLTVQDDVLGVTPGADFVTSGAAGGPFSPATGAYTLSNLSTSSLDWSASADQPWVALSATSGTLAAGSSAELEVSIAAAATSALAAGSHTATVSIVDQTNTTQTDRSVVLTIQQSSTPGSLSSITKDGITWTFDQAYPAGQFVNGDWWVVGPVTVVDVDPPSTTTGGRTINGSMVNPSPLTQSQGYDSSMYAQYKFSGSYDPLLNVADGVSPSSPLVLSPATSLISTISVPAPDQRPQVQAASVLTVLNTAPPADSFRPAYTGTNKTVRYNKGQLNWSLLAKLPRVSSMPEAGVARRVVERPWIDHIPDWVGRYAHPIENMPAFGRDMSDAIGNVALMLHTDLPDAEKEPLLIALVQIGIDFYGVVEAGGVNNWPAGGGHHSGRKWPILFAGLMLGDSAMSGIGQDQIAFNEDDQTFYVQETSPGVYNYGQGGYTAQDVGRPDWGTQHWKQINRGELPTKDDATWFGNSYRLCCTANSWWGSVLSAYIMGAKDLWNHDALFDYLDFYLEENLSRGITNWQLSWSDFPLEMWQTYRDDY